MGAKSCLLVLNSGSSSVKFSVFDRVSGAVTGHGAVTGLGGAAVLTAKGPLFDEKGHQPPALSSSCRTVSDAVHALIAWLETCWPAEALAAVGHRVVHGGDQAQHALVTPELMAKLTGLIPLAPLHQPFNLEGMRMLAQLHPQLPQVACFDTAFHTTIPALHQRFALPRVWHDKGVKRYGFHGLSYEFIAGRLKAIAPRAYAGRTLVAHLGSGASLCALRGGQSFDTSMGFSALDGLMMGTRSGTLDAGVLLYLLQHEKMDGASIETLLYRKSGLLGVSGISADMATLLASSAPEAREAVDLFCLRLVREAGGLISLLGGLDALVFTGGIGEHAAAIRAKLVDGLAWTGMALDAAANLAADGSNAGLVSAVASPVEIRVIPTDEEIVIARHVREVVQL